MILRLDFTKYENSINIDIDEMISYLKPWLSDYKIFASGTKVVVFELELEEYYVEFSLRVLFEMYLIGELDKMILISGLVAH